MARPLTRRDYLIAGGVFFGWIGVLHLISDGGKAKWMLRNAQAHHDRPVDLLDEPKPDEPAREHYRVRWPSRRRRRRR